MPAVDARNQPRKVAVIGRLGVSPMVKLSLGARRIVAYLAVIGPNIVRSRAAAELWPDLPEETGRANLRRALWHLPTGWVRAEGDDLFLDADCDLPAAREAGVSAIGGGELSISDIQLLTTDILPGWHEEWAQPVQEAYHVLRVQALEASCRTFTAIGKFALAIHAGSAVVEAEPLRESATEALIEAHLAQHNRFDAVRCYKLLADRLRIELGVSPDPALADRLGAIIGSERLAS